MPFEKIFRKIVLLVLRMEKKADEALKAAQQSLTAARDGYEHAEAELQRIGHDQGEPREGPLEPEMVCHLGHIRRVEGLVALANSCAREDQQLFGKLVTRVEMMVLGARDAARRHSDVARATAMLNAIFMRALVASRKVFHSRGVCGQADSLMRFAEAVWNIQIQGDETHGRVVWFVTSKSWFDGQPLKQDA